MKSMIMSNRTSARRLRLESLEERTLLAVTAGLAEPAAALAAPTGAANWVVNTTDDPSSWSEADDILSLREAIGRAASGDTITFDSSLAGGTITLSGSELSIVDKGVTIDAGGIGGMTIDANSQSRVFSIGGWDSENTLAELIGLTITGGYVSDGGGGISNIFGELTLTNCTVTGNTDTSNSVADSGGGGIYTIGYLTLTNCIISENTARFGGGIYSTDGAFTLANCTISGNSAKKGGGIHHQYGNLTLTNCVVTGNSSSDEGGGIYNYNNSSLTLTNCTISENTATYKGGGICNYNNSTLKLTNCTVVRNSASSEGGAFYNNHGTLKLTNCTVVRNSASSEGGAFYNSYGTLRLTNCTVSGNTATYNGGGIYSYGTAYLYNTIIAQNNNNNNNITFHDEVYAYNCLSSFTDWTSGSSNNLVYESLQPLFSDSANGDYSLAAGSLAINRGDNSYISDSETDLAGNPRIFDGTVDIGAYEYQEETNDETPSTIVTTNLDVVDTTDGLISLREAIVYAEEGDTITFDASLTGGTIILCGSDLFIDKGITIDASAIGGIIIDADRRSSVFFVQGGAADRPVELKGLTITGGGHTDNSYDVGEGVYSKGWLTMTNCAVIGNCGWCAGGVYNDSGTLTMTNCIVSGNIGTSLYVDETGSGGIGSRAGRITLTNCTVTNNTSNCAGGGIGAYACRVSLTNCTVSGNSARYGGGISIYGFGSNGRPAYIYNSIIMGGVGGPLSYDSSGNLIENLGPICAYNTLSSFTGWASGSSGNLVYDSSVSLRSQTVDKGNNGYVTVETDIAGNPRIIGGTVDIGAEEFVPGTPSIIVDTKLDVVDSSDGLTSLREAISKAEEGDVICFASNLAGTAIALDGTQLEITKGITINASAIGGITIDAGNQSRVFNIDGGSASNPVELNGLTITGGLSEDGGGISNYSNAVLTMTNCLIYGNNAERYGGGIENRGTMSLYNCTLAENGAQLGGGAFCYTGTSSNFYNTIVVLNTADTAAKYGDIYNKGTVNAYNTISSFTGWTESSAPYVYNSSLPLFADGYSLAENSQAIDKGNNDYLICRDNDLAGNPRISGGTVDIGAYEYQGEDGGRIYETPSTLVTTHLDIVDPTDNLVSLREAISYAAQGDTITFDSSLAVRGVVLNGTELIVSKGITIDASSIGGMTISANLRSRVFNIATGQADAPVNLIALTITGGHTYLSHGGGIYNGSGRLTMTNCTVSGNTVDNTIYEGSPGGGIYNNGTLTLMNCVVAGNHVTASGSAYWSGGGIYNYGTSAVLTLINCTVTGNSANDANGIFNLNGTAYLYNTIVAQNDNEYNIVSTSYIYGYNSLSSFTGWTSGSSNNQTYKSSQPLFTDAAHGDYTLAENSQAIDKGNNAYVETETDLAGNPRIVGGIVDLGAYEYQSGGGQTEQLAAPVISTGSRGVYASHGANRHQIQWSAVANASGYELAYSADGVRWTTVSASGTGAVVTGLTYGADVTYRVRALGAGSYTDSDWSAVKVFNVCPMDINGDGDIAGSDRTIMATSWLAEEGDDEYRYYADINGDGEVSNTDRPFIGQNWNKEAGDDDLVYPRPVRAADAVFAVYESGGIDVDLNIF